MSGEARCKIFLEGVVSERDLLFISRVEDRDELLFENQVIGNTGNILGRTFHAGFFPRVYSLSAIAGRKDAVLSIHAWGNLGKSAGIPSRAKVKMIDDHYPLWKILGPGALQILSFLFLGWIGLFAAAGSRERITDGWIYSPDDMRTLLGGLAIFLILRHEVSGLFVPLIWSSETHLFSQQVALFAMLWAANQLLLGGRFFDRSSIEQPRSKFPARWLPRIAHLALILSLGTLASFRALSEREQALLLAVPLVPLMLAQIKALMDLEWRKAVKRSTPSPFLFHLSLLALPYAVISTAASAWFSYGGDLGWLDFSGWAILLLAGLRRRSQNRIREMARILAADCRMKMLEHHSAGFRLRIFTEFVAEDWGAARVSVLSINQDTGLVLFSAGPDALPEGNRFTPQKLGPFLRRACKRGRMLYAPVAEELGQDLQSQGLKHSSLTIPISQENQVRAVICMMADEGERIPPQDANLLEDFVDLLSLEILSAAEQTVSDQRTLQLMNIARTADALAVENQIGRAHV